MMPDLDTSVALKWYVLCSQTTNDAGEAREMTQGQADDLNGRLAVRNDSWRWVQFTEIGQAVA